MSDSPEYPVALCPLDFASPCLEAECAIWTRYGCGMSHNITVHREKLDVFDATYTQGDGA